MLTGRTHQGLKLRSLTGIRRQKPVKTWIVVAHQFGATIISWTKGTPLTYVGRLRKGSSHTNARVGSTSVSRRSEVPRHTPQTLAADTFAKAIADSLEVGRITKRFDRLILIAEPKFMGRLHHALDTKTKKLLCKSIEKDFAHLSKSELLTRVDNTCEML